MTLAGGGFVGHEETAKELRAVTLFDLEEFRSMSQTAGKHVVLMVRPCNSCGHTRAKALVAMLDSPQLQVFSDLVLDERTAMDAVNLKQAKAQGRNIGAPSAPPRRTAPRRSRAPLR